MEDQLAVGSYTVLTKGGRVYRRNRSYLYNVAEKYQPSSDDEAVQSEKKQGVTESPAPQMPDGSVTAGGSQTDPQLLSSNTPVPVTTRSGRIVKRPAYLQDLVV